MMRFESVRMFMELYTRSTSTVASLSRSNPPSSAANVGLLIVGGETIWLTEVPHLVRCVH